MLNIILTVHLIIALGLISIVLIQRSEGGGLGIGGGGSGGGMTGRPGITALGKVTWALGIAFVITSITLTVLASQNSKDSSILDGINPNNASGILNQEDSSGSSKIDDSSPLTPPRADK
jgi:preprotein translocase subunit SecG